MDSISKWASSSILRRRDRDCKGRGVGRGCGVPLWVNRSWATGPDGPPVGVAQCKDAVFWMMTRCHLSTVSALPHGAFCGEVTTISAVLTDVCTAYNGNCVRAPRQKVRDDCREVVGVLELVK